MKILMVCLGNICRSPLAHGILESKLDKLYFTVDSAGTSGYHEGQPPDYRSIKVALQKGIDISGQRARKFTLDDFDRFDRIYTMDNSNLDHLHKMARHNKDREKIKLFLNSNLDSGIEEVPDPYYGDFSSFEFVFKIINDTCNSIAKELTPTP